MTRPALNSTISVNGESPIPSLRQDLLPYLAGFFDGEGCITVQDCKSKDSDRRIYVLKVCVVNTDLRMPTMFKRIFGGYVFVHRGGKGYARPAHWQPCGEWSATNGTAVLFLKAVYPYLRVKKHQAALAFKFRELMEQSIRTKDAHRLNLRAELVRQIKSTNHRANRWGRNGEPKDEGVETVKGTLSKDNEDPVQGLEGCLTF